MVTVSAPTAYYGTKEEVIVTSYQPLCIRCLHKTVLCISMPYGTDFAGNYICPDCLHELVDPAIAIAIANRKAKEDRQMGLFGTDE